MTLTAVSMFAGIGGFDLAMKRNGINVVAAVEKDKAARGVLADRFPETTLFEDVRTVTSAQLIATGFVPDRGIVAAGWPCQGNSTAGPRSGMDDPRSGLWSEVVRILDELRPLWFVGENVPGLLSVNGGRDFAVVAEDLANLGYQFSWRVLDAQHFGVPQRRRRVIIVGHLGDAAGPREVLFEPAGSARDSSARGKAEPDSATETFSGFGVSGEPGGVAHTLTARDVKGPLPEASLGTVVIHPVVDVVSTIQGGRSGLASRRRSGSRRASRPHGTVAALTSAGGGPDDNEAQAGHLIAIPFAIRGRDDGAQIELGAENGPSNALRDSTGGGSSHAFVAVCVTGEVTHALTGTGHDASEDGTGRGAPITIHLNQDPITAKDLSPAIGAKGHIGAQGGAAGVNVRRLTPLERERLQGFPDNHTATSNGKEQADGPRDKQTGNAVAVPVFEWVFRRLVAYDTDGAA